MCYNNNNDTVYSHFSISNISDEPIDIKIIFYNINGQVLKDDGRVSSGNLRASGAILNYNDQLSEEASVIFTLEANKTAIISIYPPMPFFTSGYGVIEWSQDSYYYDNAVVAYGYTDRIMGTQYATRSIIINNGNPF